MTYGLPLSRSVENSPPSWSGAVSSGTRSPMSSIASADGDFRRSRAVFEHPDDLGIRRLDVPAGGVGVRRPDPTVGIEVDLARVRDAGRQRIDHELLGCGIEAQQRVGVGAADPHRVRAPIDVQRVWGLAPRRVGRQGPRLELLRLRVEARHQAGAEAGYPEIAFRVEAQTARSRERGIEELVSSGVRIDPSDAMDVQLTEPDTAVGGDVDAVWHRQHRAFRDGLRLRNPLAEAEEPRGRAHRERLRPRAGRQADDPLLTGLRIDHPDLIRYGQCEPDASLLIKAQRVRIEAVLQIDQPPRFRLGIE